MSKVINRVLGGGGSGYYPSASFRAEDFDENGSVTLSGQGKSYNAIWKRNEPRLPSAYQEVEYIQSTGTQYIDSGYILNTSTSSFELKAECQTIDTSLGTSIFGINNAYCITTSSTNKVWAFRYASTSLITTSVSALSTTIIKGTSSYTKFNNTEYQHTTSQYSNSYNALIFARNSTSGVAEEKAGTKKLYYCKIWDNNVLVRDFIPCYRKSDSVIGLYDLVNDVFYTNQGTGTFLMGRPINALPQGYQEVEYIQSSGTQYIDTQYNAKTTTEIGADYTVASILGNYDFIFGAKTTHSTYNFSIQRYLNGSNIGLLVNDGSEHYVSGSQYYQANTNYTLYTSNGKWLLNGTQIYSGGTTITQYPLFISAVNYAGSPTEYGALKFHNFHIKESGTIVRNYIPCYRTSDNEIGLYDIVNGQFYQNSGSGTFAKGDNVENGYFDIEKIDEVGSYTCVATQGIQTKTESILIDLPIHYDFTIEFT